MNLYDLIIVQPIFNALLFIYSLIPGGDFGVALIIFTVIVRFLLYPLVKRQLHQTRLMRKLQPELKKIKKAAAGDRQKEALQMMELYKRHGVSPFRSIGMLLIQLPIFIGLYHVVQIFTQHTDQIERYTYEVLRSMQPVADLIADPSRLNLHLFGFIDLTGTALSTGNIALFLLAGLAAFTQFVMSKQIMPTVDGDKKGFRQIMSEAAAGKQPDQSELNTVMMGSMLKVMPVMMFFIMVSVPGALALYYAISNLVAVGQQSYLLRQDTEELEEIADEPDAIKPAKKSSKTASREKKATNATITRISAKDTRRSRQKKKRS